MLTSRLQLDTDLDQMEKSKGSSFTRYFTKSYFKIADTSAGRKQIWSRRLTLQNDCQPSRQNSTLTTKLCTYVSEGRGDLLHTTQLINTINLDIGHRFGCAWSRETADETPVHTGKGTRRWTCRAGVWRIVRRTKRLRSSYVMCGSDAEVCARRNTRPEWASQQLRALAAAKGQERQKDECVGGYISH